MPAAPPQMERGRRARPPVPLVYGNSFGSHRCGTVIRLGRGWRQSRGQSPPGRPGAPRAAPEPRAGRSPRPGDPGTAPLCRVLRGLEVAQVCFNANFLYVSHFIFQSKVWHKVWKVISKMLEENERFRSRLLTCSQLDGEGTKLIANVLFY
uniref:Uncharacterized protein n=1 Tax=Junco hyemalis TaxID=40217 RepID=A0A8C5IPU9_JUNHY